MKRSGQALVEYMMMISILVAALFATQVYIKRSMQGRLHETMQQVVEGNGYSPGATNANSTIISTTHEHSTSDDNVTDTTTNLIQVTHRSEGMLPFGSEPGRW
jgi:hypothetical protein